ncbi:MAG TPA: hypothetical protein VG778_08480 [Blastocatellia bacterium]|nr:hypothetical protein [Blastocatellia bacterium]
MDLNSFWYIYATDGTNGFLLDLIKRPAEAVARLAVYENGKAPTVVHERLGLDQFSSGNGDLNVRLGPLKLGPNGCQGKLGNIDLDVLSTLDRGNITFVPAWLHKLLSYVPYFSSHYGTLLRGKCQQAEYAGLPFVYSTYQVGDIARSKWFIISASQFKDSDLSFEISASRIAGIWGASAYVFYQGREYKLNSPIASLFTFRTRSAGEIAGEERIFDVSIRSPLIRMDVKARAPLSDFARLEKEGETEIHTTLFGDCAVEVTLRGTNANAATNHYEATRTCLLEVKNEP